MNVKQVFVLLTVVNVMLFLTYIALHVQTTCNKFASGDLYQGMDRRDRQTPDVVHMEPKIPTEAASIAEKNEIITNTDERDTVLSFYEDSTTQLEQTTKTKPKETTVADTKPKETTVADTKPKETTVADTKPKETPVAVVSPSLQRRPAPVETEMRSEQTHTHAEGTSTLNSGQRKRVPGLYAGTENRTQNTQNVAQDPDKAFSPYIWSSEDNQKCLSFRHTKGNVSNAGRPKLLVYWQDHDSFPERRFQDLCTRPTLGPCELSFDLKLHKKADAIVFHASNIRIKEPPFSKRPGQVWIARGLESPIHWYPDYKTPAWKGAFNWTFTIRPDSELFSPVGVLYKNPDASKKDYRIIAERKTRSIAWFVSDCQTLSKREDYVKKLKKYIDVDIYGECGTLECSKNQRRSCFDMLEDKYRFYLAFENSICPYYATEKIFNKYGVSVIPVVRGGFDYKKYFPDGTYINAADFQYPKDLAKYLNKLGNDPDAYAAMLARHDEFQHSNCLQQEPWCKMCDMLHDNTVKPRVYKNLGSWWDETPCLGEKDVKDIP